MCILGSAMANDLELGGATPSTNGAPPQRTGGRLPHQLPSGRHGLPRDFVEKNQRERILRAVEVLAAGPPALASRAAAMEAFRAFLEPGFDEAPEGLPVPALAAETAIGGAYEVIYSLILQDRTAELPALLPDLLQIVLLPVETTRRRWLPRAELVRRLAVVQADAGLRNDLAALAGDTTDDLDPIA